MRENPIRETDPFFDWTPHGLLVDLFSDERFEAIRERFREEGLDAGEAYKMFDDEQVRQVRTDPEFRRQLRERYRAAGVNLPTVSLQSNDQSPAGQWENVARWQARIDTTEWMQKALSPDGARTIVDDGDVGVIITTQNLGRAIDGDVSKIEQLYNIGLRMASPTYNSQNLAGAGCTERNDGGLSFHGVDVIETMNDLGIMVELSHCGPATTMDAIDVSDDPVMFSHTACESISGHDLSKSDEELEAIASVDGFVGIQNTPSFNVPPGREGEEWEVFFDHIDHAVDVVGVDRVGIGQDWGLVTTTEMSEELIEGFEEFFGGYGFRGEHDLDFGIGFGPMEHYSDTHLIPEELCDRGYTAEEVRDICGRNFLTFWDRVAS
jgi:membrane dipeptidase